MIETSDDELNRRRSIFRFFFFFFFTSSCYHSIVLCLAFAFFLCLLSAERALQHTPRRLRITNIDEKMQYLTKANVKNEEKYRRDVTCGIPRRA